MKVKHFTHTDLDGIGCGIVSKIAYGDDVEIVYCDYHNVNDIVGDYVSSRKYLDYDLTLITDISVDEIKADLLNYIFNQGNKVVLLDHHSTAEWLNRYEWASVNPLHAENTKSSGTSMLYLYLSDNTNLIGHYLSKFVELVRRYDTWEWQTKYNDLHAKQLNDLLYIIGRDRFIKRFLDDIKPTFKPEESTLLELEQEKIDKYIESKSKQIIEEQIYGRKVGVVFAERYSSQLGNVLAERNPHLDLIAIINPSYSVSYRTVKDDVHLGEFAKIFGGGGHPKASGSQVNDDQRKEIIDIIFRS